MESILTLKASDEEAAPICIICQKVAPRGQKLPTGEWKSIQSLQKAATLRESKYDPKNRGAINRIKVIDDPTVRYHSNCYASFTSKQKIGRLTDIVPNLETVKNNNVEATDQINPNIVIWTECILCQDGEKKEHKRQIREVEMQQKIRDLAEKDSSLNLRINGSSTNLIAKGTFYHTNCLNTATRKYSNVNNGSAKVQPSNLALKELCAELHVAAEKGEVFQLRDVFARYVFLAEKFNEIVPRSFISRLSTFKEKLIEFIGGVYQFYQPLNVDVESRQMLLIPTKYQFSLISDAVTDGFNSSEPIYSATSNDNTFINRVHTALQIHSDIKSMSGHKGLNISQKEAKEIVPESLYTFLCLLSRGQDSLDEILESEFCDSKQFLEDDDEVETEVERKSTDTYKDRKNIYENKILSIAQDIIYLVSKGKKLTPKHIGLGLTLHQMTRSRKLVSLFSKAGHCITYPQLLQIDNTLADLTLSTLDYSTGSVVPPNFKPAPDIDQSESHLKPAPILQLTADNIDIQTDTLDGKKSFHATQIVAFQRGALSSSSVLHQLEIKKKVSFRIPQILNQLPADPMLPQFSPTFEGPINTNWYKRSADVPASVRESKSTDMAFLLSRQNESEENYIGWTEFNQNISRNNASITTQGFLPLILNPAHETTTLLLFLERAISLADNLNYRYVVLTVDQALHLKLVELKMSNPIYQKRVIVKMGGLHLAMNYLKAIGQHMTDTGLAEIWKESDLLADGSILKVIDGKAYSKAMRAHKLTSQAMWRILIPRLLTFIKGKSAEFHTLLTDKYSNVEDLATVLRADNFSSFLSEFVEQESSKNINFKFWWTYLDSVSILLLFTRSIRDGNFSIYPHALKNMLPLMERYNHRNYVKSLSIYIAELNQLPTEIKLAFNDGDFVVKATEGRFNQVDADHAQEWLVGVSKDSGGIVGITQKANTLQRWALSFGWRTEITQKTFSMYGFNTVSGITNEATAARRKRDGLDEQLILRVLTHFNIFSTETYSGIMQNIVTKDVATEDIQTFLLNVAEDGEKQVLSFVKERLIGDENGKRTNFDEPLTQNTVNSMKKLYEVAQKPKEVSQQKVLKIHGNMLQRLIMAFEAGREMNLEHILERELHEYPLSLVNANGQLRSGNPLDTNVLIKPTDCVTGLSNLKQEAHLIVTGQTMVQEIPKNLKTFGDLAQNYARDIKYLAEKFSRIDIVFDRSNANSLKADKPTRKIKKQPIRRIIENGSVALPKAWNEFLAHPQNEEELYRFLSLEIGQNKFEGTDVLLAGGFPEKVICTNAHVFIEHLKCSHEEEVSRIILHAVSSTHKVVVVHALDMNIFVLLIHHFEKMKCKELWLRAGTSKKRIYVPIHTICSNLTRLVKQNILAFDALTGSHITSFIAGITKNTAWKIYLEHTSLLSDLGEIHLTENAIRSAEEFVVKLYKVGRGAKTTNTARYLLFGIVKAPEFLPPTSDAIVQHIKRSYYQTVIWQNAHEIKNNLMSQLDYGWKLNDMAELKPLLSTQDPVTNKCIEVTSCGCNTPCETKRCPCVKLGMGCTALCNCTACKNIRKK